MDGKDKVTEVLTARGSVYGPFSGHAMVTRRLKEVMYSHPGFHEKLLRMSVVDRAVVSEGLDMIAHKLGRIVNGDPLYNDNWVDIAGYAKLVPEHAENSHD